MRSILIIFGMIFMFVVYAYFGVGSIGIPQNQNTADGTATTSNNTLANPFHVITNIISNDQR